MTVQYRSKRMRAIHGLPPRPSAASALADKWTPDQAPGQLFQPWALTTVLDLAELYDPELSDALGVGVGEVDRWEEGQTIPTHEQAQALAKLTGYPLRWFYRPGPPPEMSAVFMCPGGYAEPTVYASLGRGRWKIVRDRPDALLPPTLFDGAGA